MKRQLAVFAKSVAVTALCLLLIAGAALGFFTADSRIAGAVGRVGGADISLSDGGRVDITLLGHAFSIDTTPLLEAAQRARALAVLLPPELRLVVRGIFYEA